MKWSLFIFSLLALRTISWSQKELVNVYNSFSEVYGGMEDGGVSRTESFYFVAFATVEVKNMLYNNEKIILQNGDSLIVNVGKYIPYNPEPVIDTVDTSIPAVYKPDFRVLKFGHTFYANVQFPYVWPGIIDYIYKKKTYASKIKEGFDNGYTGYAP